MASSGREMGDGSDLTCLPFSAQPRLLVLVDLIQRLVLMPLAPGGWSQDGAGWRLGLSSSASHKEGFPRTSSND